MSIIYKTTLIDTGLIYVGQHDGSKNYYLGSGTFLKGALKLWNRNRFTRETLETLPDDTPQDVIDERETY